jgi:hypothetical protein
MKGRSSRAAEQQSIQVLSDASNRLVEPKRVGCAVGLADNVLVEGQPIDTHIRRVEEERLAWIRGKEVTVSD